MTNQLMAGRWFEPAVATRNATRMCSGSGQMSRLDQTVDPATYEVSTASEKRADLSFAIAGVLLTLYAILNGRAALLHASPDITVYYLKWYEHIVRYGRWASLEGSYANYSPPYLYILSLVSFLNGKISSIILIKLAQVPGMIAAAGLFWSICRKLGCSQTRSLLAAWIILVAPEVFQNTLLWGQCDMLHTACLLLMVRLLLAKRAGWAMAALGMALAFKLQAIFVGATVAALFLSGEVPLWSALCVPAAYMAMMIPAHLAGRPWRQLLLIYSQQYDAQPDIAKSVANPYQLIYHFSMRHGRFYWLALHAAFLVTAVASIGLIWFLSQSRWRLRGERLVFAVAAPLLISPYLLPKMHDRYFFAGDVMVLLLMMLRPKLWAPAAMLQVSALITAFPHLYRGGWDQPTSFYYLPVALTTCAVVWLGKILIENESADDSALAGRQPN
jgi:Gpi18-like mannosyltransferase